MNIVDKAFQTQLTHIQEKTGKSLDQINKLIRSSGLTRHAEIREMLKRDLGLGHGDANTLARFYMHPADEGSAQAEAGQVMLLMGCTLVPKQICIRSMLR
jgi:hypothetical protein